MKILTENDNLAYVDSFRKRAIRWFPLKDKCERCKDAKATDRHHRDGNPRRNVSSNIAHLCRRCHMIEDGRLEILVKRNKEVLKYTRITAPRPCIVCLQLKKPLRKGRCHRCNEYHRKHGVEWSPQAPKAHCKNGHAFSDSNTYIRKNGHRHCRSCHAANERRRRNEKQR